MEIDLMKGVWCVVGVEDWLELLIPVVMRDDRGGLERK